MRLVTMDKKTDVPYESVTLELNENKIEGFHNMGGARYVFGEYATNKDAEYVMKALRDAYRRNESVFAF